MSKDLHWQYSNIKLNNTTSSPDICNRHQVLKSYSAMFGGAMAMPHPLVEYCSQRLRSSFPVLCSCQGCYSHAAPPWVPRLYHALRVLPRLASPPLPFLSFAHVRGATAFPHLFLSVASVGFATPLSLSPAHIISFAAPPPECCLLLHFHHSQTLL